MLVILWMALHSAKIIFAVFVNLFIGLTITTAVGLWMVGSLNLLSIAFAVLFVGLGVDFGIQFSVRYRSERFKNDDLREALAECGATLRGAAVARRDGDRSRLPLVPADRLQGHLRARPDRRRRHAGCVPLQHHGAAGAADAAQSAGRERAARLCLPRAGRPLHGGAPHPDHRRHAAGRDRRTAAALLLQFDFNPINLRNPKVESIATFLDLRKDPITGANAINVLANSEADARQIEAKLEKLPEVAACARSTVSCRRPAAKLKLIAKARQGRDARVQSGLGRCGADR